MTIGVDSFVGGRLTEAREARGIMTQSSLADILSVSNNTINGYENNKSKPRPEMVSDLAKVLNVKELFFFQALPFTEPNTVFWRSRHTTTKERRTIAERKFGWTKWLIDNYLKSFMDMPVLNLPTKGDLGIPNDPKNLTDEKIEEITLLLRQFWGLGRLPIDNVTALLENNGILITYGLVNSEKLDAFSNVSEYDNSFHIFLSSDKKSAVRSRFDAVHELGHLILHSHLPSSYFNEKNHMFIENQANRFASAFLLPYESFKKDVWIPINYPGEQGVDMRPNGRLEFKSNSLPYSIKFPSLDVAQDFGFTKDYYYSTKSRIYAENKPMKIPFTEAQITRSGSSGESGAGDQFRPGRQTHRAG